MTMTDRPPFDAAVTAALLERPDLVVTAMHPEDIPVLRGREEVPDLAALTLDGAYALSEHTVPGPAGAPDVELVLLRPTGAQGPVPVLFYVHGGGLVTGNRHLDLPGVLETAAPLGCAVAAVEYRLAPESTYPAAAEDVYAGLRWLAGEADALGLDAGRIVVSGMSAGGGLAAVVALLSRERGGPRLLGQMLLCPMLDDRNDSPSAHQMAGHGLWDRTANATGWAAYLGDRAGGPDVPWDAAAARAEDLSGLPPAFLDVGSAETFRDEVVAYASRLWLCGGDAELHVWPGGAHAFDMVVPDAPLSQDAKAARRRWLSRLLDRVPR